MNFLKVLLVLGLAGGAYHFWNVREAASALKSADVSPNGFIAVPAPTNLKADTVIVLAAENCPKEDAVRADRLADELRRRNIPHTRAHSASFSFPDPDPAVVTRLNAVMKGPLPVVFVNGRAKANPSLDEVLAEYAAS